MKFIGTIKPLQDSSFMLGLPILGMCVYQEKFYIGPITGDINDIKIGYKASKDYTSFVEFMSDLCQNPLDYNMRFCNYKEACKEHIDLLDKNNSIYENVFIKKLKSVL